jgi:hypothetical protein
MLESLEFGSWRTYCLFELCTLGLARSGINEDIIRFNKYLLGIG